MSMTAADVEGDKRDMNRVDLHGLDLRGANLSHGNFISANFISANLNAANCQCAEFRAALLSGADLRGADCRMACFGEADLSGADLTGADLTDACLDRANLGGATFSAIEVRGASLRGTRLPLANLKDAQFSKADLSGADLFLANLERADLAGANLRGANLTLANLAGANLSGADLRSAVLVQTNLEGANLRGCSIYGISAWTIQGEPGDQSNLVIKASDTDTDEATFTVDNLEIAQFIYLLLKNKKFGDLIDTMTSKVVLILGNFAPERKAVLERIRDAIRRLDRVPIIFDWRPGPSRDETETVRTLAHLARYVIVDLTDPRSVSHELASFVPDVTVPVVSIIDASQEPYSMLSNLRRGRRDWVLEPVPYESPEALMLALPQLMEAAEAAVKRIAPRPVRS